MVQPRLESGHGFTDIRRWTNGYHNDNVYFNNPVSYIPNKNDWGRLAALRQTDIILVTGQDDPLRQSTEELSGLLWQKGIGNALRIWDGWSRDWPFWQQMLRLYISGHD